MPADLVFIVVAVSLVILLAIGVALLLAVRRLQRTMDRAFGDESPSVGEAAPAQSPEPVKVSEAPTEVRPDEALKRRHFPPLPYAEAQTLCGLKAACSLTEVPHMVDCPACLEIKLQGRP